MTATLTSHPMITFFKLLNPRLTVGVENSELPHIVDHTTVGAVIAIPFNRYIEGEKPDRSNRAITCIAATFCKIYKLPFYGQYEQCSIFPIGKIVNQYKTKKKGEWVQTNELIKWVARELTKQGKPKKVILICHPYHGWRCATLCERYGISLIVPKAVRYIHYDPFKRSGYQWWCTSKYRYIFWEYCVARPALLAMILFRRL